MTDLDSLIEELEKATEDNQYIVIYDVLQFAHREGWITARKFDQASNWRFNGAYLDAALTLVPEGWLLKEMGESEAGSMADHPFYVRLFPREGAAYNAMFLSGESSREWQRPTLAKSFALALCIAALKARRE